jgi:superfamily II DNA or RNA helicase
MGVQNDRSQTNKPSDDIVIPPNLNTYIGQKGYTVLKSEIPIKTQLFIKDQLMFKPFTPGSPVNNSVSFPCYRESSNKLYLPRYFGEELFGVPKLNKLPSGEPINLTFNGTMRDYQQPVIRKCLDHLTNLSHACALLELYCAWGKTSAALYMICELGLKVVIIVHKEFLMNQWIERIQQFIPSAKIGKIQGNMIDIDGKDIVLCMLQSLVLKNYPQDLFNSFGLTIIDEVHHISSETFSNALFKVVTKYMIGLSATMERKDGTTKAFKMFLGDVLHKAERKTTFEVEIRGLMYKTNDDEYNDTILTWDGKPQISSMISKVCQYSLRTEFVINTLVDFIRKNEVTKDEYISNKQIMDQMVPNCELCERNNNYLMKNICCNCVKYCLLCLENIKPKIVEKCDRSGNKSTVKMKPKCPNCQKVLKYEQNYVENPHIKTIDHLQTIVLAHNLNVLEYMYTKFVCKNLASVGYYVGGMKEEELKRSETKQVIFATYALANEGLDIPTLNAEFLITPKTDVVQTIGRVLRAKHSISDPIIYDIYDAHSVFVKQWGKRKSYYKKQGYKIVELNSNEYNRGDNWRLTTKSKIISSCGSASTKPMTFFNKTANSSSSSKSATNDSDDSDVSDGDCDGGSKMVKKSVARCLLKIKK